ncbi:MAG TPA: LysR family transcriptional regulator [Pusillimonas sp.]|nr:LysR family transcriptional regulator [Pusillimonas sp.]
MNIYYRQLKAFVQVAQSLNFTRAAEELHVTQAGLSFMMQQLESQLSCRLFDRTTRQVSLTVSGEYFLPVAHRVVESLNNATEELAQLTTEARNKLVIGVTPLVSSNMLPTACATLARSHPDAKINIVATDHEHIQALVEAGELDFGLGAHFKAGPGIQLQALFKYQLMWVTPNKWDANELKGAGPLTVPWEAMANTALVRLPSDNQIQQVIETHLRNIGRHDKEHHTFNNFELLIAMVASGAGTAILPSYAIGACRRHGVQTAILTDPVVSMDFYQITKRRRLRPELMDAFTKAFISSIPT